MRRRSAELSDAFAEVLREQREQKKLSRETLAEKANLHQTYVGLLERGLRNPSIDAADALAAALGIPLSKLIAKAESIRNGQSRD